MNFEYFYSYAAASTAKLSTDTIVQ